MQLPISTPEYRQQCAHAAYSARLNPKALHHGEAQLLSGWTTDKDIQKYLSVRNGVLRLWHRNPLVIVTRDEALSIIRANDQEHLILIAHEWLTRNGYINFGCVDVPAPRSQKLPEQKRKTIAIIGAGVSGLACARHLHGLFNQYRDRWHAVSDSQVPRIVVLEGRSRVGGRVYSHPLSTQKPGSLPHQLANVAEMGAQIITGFEAGNPLDIVIRGQLALEHHFLSPDMVLYDHDGSVVDDDPRDKEMDRFFNSMLELASEHSWKKLVQKAAAEKPATTIEMLHHALENNGGANGFEHGIKQPLSLGEMMDQLVEEQQKSSMLSAFDLRLLNWHFANLEYANAVNVEQLSLGGWDQDGGNEFEGRHSQIVGGYSQLPRALMDIPTPLNVKVGKTVTKVTYKSSPKAGPSVRVDCENGEVCHADVAVITVPLGVLKDSSIQFEPPLPEWKTGAIARLGFGLLNKVVLLFDEVFWDSKRDMFGLLNQTSMIDSMNQRDYAPNRGNSYLFWNCVATIGRPVLVALMAGDAAELAETATDDALVGDTLDKLQKIFKLDRKLTVIEAIVTRWRRDRFARGSYSFVGTRSLPDDYDAMARPVANLHFAGEATCISHPATVHGAYLSGLRAASEVFTSLVGPIPLPNAL